MTAVAEALSAFRARWAHPPVDPADVLERVAVRLDGAPAVYLAIATPPAVRLFRELAPGKFTSCYVHALADVGAAMDLLESRAAVRSRAA